MLDLRVTIDHVVAEGATVAVFTTARGTHLGPVTGPYVDVLVPTGRLEATGRPMEVRQTYLCEVRDGRVTILRWMADTFGLFQQLGVLPA